jgi:4-hydroxythreonine-4-phosphate dehydrogenase
MNAENNTNRKKIAYTTGDPAGIGMDIIIQAAQKQALNDIVVLANRDWLKFRAELLKLPLEIFEANDSEEISVGQLRVEHVEVDTEHSAFFTMAFLDRAIEGCISGEFSAMVTGPVNKAVINDAGIPFTGHTEYIAEKTQAELPVMMLATKGLRVALMTTHLPLRDVADAITPDLIQKVCSIVWGDLQNKFGVDKPQILLCGLNPHAGENGYLGREEIDVIEPCLLDLAKQGIEIQGPYPADTLFQEKYLTNADAVIAMYHDQGLPVLKFKGFGKSANITLGLPIIRTSVDHGTAYDLVGKGAADIGSLLTAIDVAREMATRSTELKRKI